MIEKGEFVDNGFGTNIIKSWWRGHVCLDNPGGRRNCSTVLERAAVLVEMERSEIVQDSTSKLDTVQEMTAVKEFDQGPDDSTRRSPWSLAHGTTAIEIEVSTSVVVLSTPTPHWHILAITSTMKPTPQVIPFEATLYLVQSVKM